eukprot:scaffold67770_cov82-Phaeocystis_antarctica.AAC.2
MHEQVPGGICAHRCAGQYNQPSIVRGREPSPVRARARANAGCPVAGTAYTAGPLRAARSQHEERKALLLLRVCEDAETFGPRFVPVAVEEAEQRQSGRGGV